MTFPFSYLWTDNYLEIETAKFQEEKRLAAEAYEARKLAEDRQRSIDKEERDRALYEHLKAKYEGTI